MTETTAMRVIFMGTPDFAATALGALLSSAHRIVGVYTQPPRPAGRGKRETRSPVHELAAANTLPVFTPASLRAAEAQMEFDALNADVAVVAAYGLILPPAILEAPRHGCLNIHASLLPRWRGAAPIQRAIEAGDAETGITIMQMDEGLDTGDMLLSEAVPIRAETTAGSLHDALAELGARLILDALAGIEAGSLAATPQPEAGATYASKIDKTEARIDWRRSAAEIERQVRAFNPVPGAWFELDGQRVRLLRAAVTDGSGTPGEVLDDRLTIACGAGALRPLELQRAGKGAMPAEDFLRGTPVAASTKLP